MTTPHNTALLLIFALGAFAHAQGPDPKLLPQPKLIRPGDDIITFDGTVQIGPYAAEPTHRVAQELLERDLEEAGLTVRPLKTAEEASKAVGTVAFIRQTEADLRRGVRQMFPNAPGDFPVDQAYAIDVDADPDVILIIACTDAGLYYGAQTLRQLWRVEAGRIMVSGVRQILDWPSMPLRGIHFGGFGQDLIERLAAMKLNFVVWEVNNNPKYKSHPELEGTIPREDHGDMDRRRAESGR